MRTLIIIALAVLASEAQAQGLLPPKEYDRPYKGELELIRARDQAEVRARCDQRINFGKHAIACASAWPRLNQCRIIMLSDEDIVALGYDPVVVMRHEIGHCNGWSSLHTGAR
jgi:hypothetical protein